MKCWTILFTHTTFDGMKNHCMKTESGCSDSKSHQLFSLMIAGSVNHVKPVNSVLPQQSKVFRTSVTHNVPGGWWTPGLCRSDDTPTPGASAAWWVGSLLLVVVLVLMQVGCVLRSARTCVLPCESGGDKSPKIVGHHKHITACLQENPFIDLSTEDFFN